MRSIPTGRHLWKEALFYAPPTMVIVAILAVCVHNLWLLIGLAASIAFVVGTLVYETASRKTEKDEEIGDVDV